MFNKRNIDVEKNKTCNILILYYFHTFFCHWNSLFLNINFHIKFIWLFNRSHLGFSSTYLSYFVLWLYFMSIYWSLFFHNMDIYNSIILSKIWINTIYFNKTHLYFWYFIFHFIYLYSSLNYPASSVNS